MPFGASRLSFLAKAAVEQAAAGGNLDAISLAANNYLYMSSEVNSGESSNTTATWSVWFKLANSSPRSVPFGMYNSTTSGTNDRLFGLFLFNNSVDATARFYHQTINGTIDRTSSETSLYSTGDWHHICAAYDTNGGTTPQVYVDGVQATMPAISSSIDSFPWTYIDLWINGYSDGSQTNDIEVAQLWVDNSYYDLSTNLDKFYDTTNNQAVDLGSDGTATGLTQPLIYHNGDASSFGTNSGTLSYTLQVQGSVSSSTGPAFSGAAGGGSIVYRTDTYASNVYLALPFDETNELNDVSPDINASSTQATLTSGANSTVTNAEVYWTTPAYGKALENVATSATESMAYGLSTSIPSSASGTFVIEGWFKADNSTSNSNWAISSADSNGRFLFGINNTSNITYGTENNIGLGDSNWHHLAIVCDSGTKRLYIDGVYKQATSGVNTDWYSVNTGFSTLHLGQFNATDNNDYRGHIQDFKVTIGSNRGYTGTNSGTANFTLPGSMVESFASGGGQSPFTADGVEIAAGGYLEANGSHTNNMSSTSRAGTFSFWFKDINNSTRTDRTRIFTGHDSNDYYLAGPQLWLETNNTLTVYGYKGVNNGWVMQLAISNAVTDSDWHHCAITYDRATAQSNAQVYIDGVSQTIGFTRYNNDEDGWDHRDHTRIGSYGSTNSGDVGMAVAQFWYDDTYIDIGANLDKFYDSTNSGAVDMGTDGTSSGLGAPAIYHYGNTSTFYTNNGRTSGNNIAYTLTANGTISNTDTDS